MKDEIIKAAKEFFLEKGIKKTTMIDIVKKAGTSIGNCYFYFKNKNAILAEIVNLEINEFRDKIEYFANFYSDSARKIASIIYLDMREHLDSPKFNDFIYEAMQDEHIRRHVTLKVVELIKSFSFIDKELTNMDSELAIMTYFNSSSYIIQEFSRGSIKTHKNEIIRFFIQWHLRALGILKDESFNIAEEIIKEWEDKYDKLEIHNNKNWIKEKKHPNPE